ncbi:hypothetical protein GCM10011348_31540 [Marinobacterium nitratireducens]|uniref:Uncharacterized protein n=1 Tax=Marinobacterium nitratireducens TaxID=518897 RepID=A0A917ZKU2_9GAMM|nr:hypothetical protein [Marinobacterium nitratireducens]GGO84704.1 hypothetical protein GCM10011348_31540 [Marinobacterium nitratireducens]
MMYADLIDQEDFRERLVQMGVPVAGGADAESSCRQLLNWLGQPQGASSRAQAKALVQQLRSQRELLLPDVARAVDQYLVPALG